MRRVRYYEYGGPEVLTVEEVEIPVPGPNQVLLRTEAIGTSFVDTAMRQGTSAFGALPLPGSPHGDVLGTVESVGADVTGTKVGDRVVSLVTPDAYADYAVTDADGLAPVPAGLDPAAASVLAMPAPVALRVLRAGHLAKGETVLVHSAAGGIGHLAVQLARLEGAGTIIATAGSPAKLDFTRKYGADIAISYADSDWAEQVRAAAPGGVDLVLDSVGGTIAAQSLELLAPLGRLVIYGAAGGELMDVPARSLYGLKSITGFGLLAWRAARPDEARRDITEVTEHAAAGRLEVAVQATLPLAEAARAHTVLEDRDRLGRVLLVP